ncbi:N-acetyltransferase family protein [Acinetobacter qingfengensis]|uniref:GNAT family N-acetyltransferase n=1 Tax=Acinetobacter qingfengensis TaxID=1262585 RepID=A0A1E7R5Q9_9GAMM|nr:GNAT family N-acetyltransferase [Acinetobacter qingfengensis]KAA8735597.1 N-acetyltransferase family protein [Acinetobacter qingfengensis]OEY94636.1 GNAT family N-acetyltransferase [Acinetobacter qingfengensis]
MLIRSAQIQDIPAITTIYNDAVQHTTAIWNDQLVTQQNREQWLTAKQQNNEPVFVAVDMQHQQVMGYASYGQWRYFDGYRHSIEHSIYIDTTYRGRGIGTHLLNQLIETAKQQNKHAMIAAIESGNIASIQLHQKLGFQHIGTFPQVGKKFGQWLDLTCLQLLLNESK